MYVYKIYNFIILTHVDHIITYTLLTDNEGIRCFIGFSFCCQRLVFIFLLYHLYIIRCQITKLFATASLVCRQSARLPWINSQLTVGLLPFSAYTSPNNKCCDPINPGTVIDFDGKCNISDVLLDII